MNQTAAVFFDVDFTLIYPGPAFQGEGYEAFCARHGVIVDAARFPEAVISASHILDRDQDAVYNPQIFIDYTSHIIKAMGGSGAGVEPCAAEIYREWAACQHFQLYEDVPEALEALAARDLVLGLISNTHRCLESFQEHFELAGLIDVAVSSSQHGFMKPHPSIFEAALRQVGAPAAEAVMVGDSLAHDIEGARQLGMRAVLVSRAGRPAACPPEVPVVHSLRDLLPLI